MKKKPVMIDVDTGIDDAMALVIACAAENLDIKGVTTVAGNVEVKDTTRNTLNVLDLLGRGDIPVAAGAAAPLARPLAKASYVHGATGLRGYNFKENVRYALREEPAWDFMRQVLESSGEKVTLCALGPVTNLAVLIEKYPEVKPKIERIVFMGASYHTGNPGPVQTFNVMVDPEAFRQVVHSGVPFYAVPLDTTRKAYLTAQEKEAVKEMAGPAAELVQGVLFSYGAAFVTGDEQLDDGQEVSTTTGNKEREGGKTCLHDPSTVAFLTAPELFTVAGPYYCDVECKGELTSGFTLIDKEDWYCKDEDEKHFYFVDSVNREGLKDLFYRSIRHYQNG